MTTPRKRAAIRRLFAAFDRTLDVIRAGAWADALGDLPDPLVEAGVVAAMRECESLPVPAQVRRLAEEWELDHQPTSEAAA